MMPSTRGPRAAGRRLLAAAALAGLCAGPAWSAGPSAEASFMKSLPAGAPRKLSDIYRVFDLALGQGLGAEVKASNVRVLGQSWVLLRDGHFPEVEVTLKPFKVQGLDFDKAGFLFRKLEADPAALRDWQLKVREVREVQSRMVFTLRSLARLLGGGSDDVRIQADMESQSVVCSGAGSFCGVACPVEERCRLVWDESAKTLSLQPLEERFGGHHVPRLFWFLGRGPVPKTPVLAFAGSWIPFNIQEVHVGWDEVDLSTDW